MIQCHIGRTARAQFALLGGLFLFALLLLFAASVWFLSGSPETALPGGYSLVPIYGNEIALCDAHSEVVVGPPIDGYEVCGNVIAGHVTPGRTSRLFTSRSGYFLVEVLTGRVYQGLSEKDWRVLVRSYGIAGNLDLRYP